MIDQIKPLLGKLCAFSQKRMGFKRPPKLFLRSDYGNSSKVLGRTAHYDPQEGSVTLFIHNRHPKDILRSFAHELVHHTQNLRGDLSPEKVGKMSKNYAQDNDHMRNMEKEAYLQGNMCFRDWEDTIKDKDLILIKLAESKFLKENKSMTTKITKEFLKETIKKILLEKQDRTFKKNAAGVTSSVPGTEETPSQPAPVAPGTPPAGDSLKKNQSGLPTSDALELDEAGCGSHRREDETNEGKSCPDCDGSGCPTCEVKEQNEELEEAVPTVNKDQLDDDDVVDGPGNMSVKDGKLVKIDESKIQTPEQENALYEQRFAPKNNRLFEKLVKQWTK